MTTHIRPARFWPLVVLLAYALSACAAPATATPAPTPTAPPQPAASSFAPQRLRVKNGGATPIKGLAVGFGAGWIAFGDIAPGATTDYQTVPNGVLGYAAYQFDLDSRPVSQPVIDFMGEQPLPGQAFTYIVDYDPARYSQHQAIKLLDVSTDVAATGPTLAPSSGFQGQVELDVYSGRPNPTWALSPADISLLQKKLGAMPTTAAQPYPDRLGYRGLLVTLTDQATGKPVMVWQVAAGVAQVDAGTVHDYYADSGRALERWLLQTGQSFLPADLFATTQADIASHPAP